jgi:hypothetical protein
MPIEYSKDERLEIARILEETNSPVLYRFLTDYANERAKLRKINNIEETGEF